MKTVLVRVEEWTAWLPLHTETTSPLRMAGGITAFEAEDEEKVHEIAISSTGQMRHIPTEVLNEKTGEMETQNIQHGLYAFQAVLASQAPDGFQKPDPVAPDKATTTAVVLPGAKNRAQRRQTAKKGK